MVKNYGYVRVSTNEQATDGFSLEYQKSRIKEEFEKIGIFNFEIVEDKGYSATNENRPGIIKLKKLIHKGEIETLIIHKLDRLHRNVSDNSKFINLCRRNKVNLISINEELNFDSAVGRGMINITSSLAQMESEQISERTIYGYYGKASKGLYPYSRSPYGFDKVNDKLIPNEEMKVVKYIYKNFAGDYVKLNRGIKNDLNVHINTTLIKRVLHNTIYRGYLEILDEKIFMFDPYVEENQYIKEQEILTLKKENNQANEKNVPEKKMHHTYKYHNLVYYKGKRMKHKSARNRHGKVYLYYVSDKCKISEIMIDKLLRNANGIISREYAEDVVEYSNCFLNHQNENILIDNLKHVISKYEVGCMKKLKRINVINSECIQVEFEEKTVEITEQNYKQIA